MLLSAQIQLQWLYAYLACCAISTLASFSAFLYINRLDGDALRSTVRFVMLCFLGISTIYSFSVSMFYSVVITTLSTVPSMRNGMNNREPHSASFFYDGLRNCDQLRSLAIALLITDNVLYLLTTYFFLLIARELFKLALVTMDRGALNEQAVNRRYAKIGFLIFFMVSLASFITIAHDSVITKSYRWLVIVEQFCTISSTLLVLVFLIVLRCRGRKMEHLHGLVLASPLYRRLKLILIAFIIFTAPHCSIQIYMMINIHDTIPDFNIGLTTSLHYLLGAALAFVMTASQTCCIHVIKPLLPSRIKSSRNFIDLMNGAKADSNTSEEVVPPSLPVFVCTDIESSSQLWSCEELDAVNQAQDIHDDLLRNLLSQYGGYEITTFGDAFLIAFSTIQHAINYCLDVQIQLLEAKWPRKLIGLVESTQTVRSRNLRRSIIFRGLRVRMGIHDANEAAEGKVVTHQHPITGKTIYMGLSEMIAHEIGDIGNGGQIIVTKRIAEWLKENPSQVKHPHRCDFHSKHEMPHSNLTVQAYQVYPKALAGRQNYFAKQDSGPDLIISDTRLSDFSQSAHETSPAQELRVMLISP